MNTSRTAPEPLELPGSPPTWLWAFTCPEPDCSCRTAVVLGADDRETVRTRGRPVADAWLGDGSYAQIAGGLKDVTVFAVDLDTRDVYPAVGDAQLDLDAEPAVKAIVDRLDDETLDTFARAWHLGKGEPLPPAPGAAGATIDIERWRPGDLVVWDEAQPALRSDTFVFGEQIFDPFELYCVEPSCDCGAVIVDFLVTRPRGAPHPGRVVVDGNEVMLQPDHERHRARLEELWAAYCRRHPRYLERFALRRAVMHGLAGRVVTAPQKPRRRGRAKR